MSFFLTQQGVDIPVVLFGRSLATIILRYALGEIMKKVTVKGVIFGNPPKVPG